MSKSILSEQIPHGDFHKISTRPDLSVGYYVNNALKFSYSFRPVSNLQYLIAYELEDKFDVHLASEMMRYVPRKDIAGHSDFKFKLTEEQWKAFSDRYDLVSSPDKPVDPKLFREYDEPNKEKDDMYGPLEQKAVEKCYSKQFSEVYDQYHTLFVDQRNTFKELDMNNKNNIKLLYKYMERLLHLGTVLASGGIRIISIYNKKKTKVILVEPLMSEIFQNLAFYNGMSLIYNLQLQSYPHKEDD